MPTMVVETGLSANMLFMVLTGLALFLFGMQQLEAGIRALGLKTFQKWLTWSTGSPIGSVATGIAVTGILQSSSLVSLLVLAFASAEVLPLYNAIGILLGANLGTTLTGWIVTAIGFKLSMGAVTLPLLGLGATLQLVQQRFPKPAAIGRILFGLGLILFGLEAMKDIMAEMATDWDINALKGQSSYIYFAVGAVIAALIQSSSATMMLTLAALNSNIISLQAAAAIVIGANLGTTSTTVLAGFVGGGAIKKQLALAHLVFNIVVDVGAFFILLPALPLAVAKLGAQDPLVMLVGFHSLFNLIGVLIFLPLLRPFADWISKQFAEPPNLAVALMHQPAAVPEVALIAVDKALEALIADFSLLITHYVQLPPEATAPSKRMASAIFAARKGHTSEDERYRQIKATESAIFAFGLKLEEEPLTQPQRKFLKHQIRQARTLTYSAKVLKGIHLDLHAISEHPHAQVVAIYNGHREFLRLILSELFQLYEWIPAKARADKIQQLKRHNENQFKDNARLVPALVANHNITGEELSTLLNMNHEINHAVKGLLEAAESWWFGGVQQQRPPATKSASPQSAAA